MSAEGVREDCTYGLIITALALRTASHGKWARVLGQVEGPALLSGGWRQATMHKITKGMWPELGRNPGRSVPRPAASLFHHERRPSPCSGHQGPREIFWERI